MKPLIHHWFFSIVLPGLGSFATLFLVSAARKMPAPVDDPKSKLNSFWYRWLYATIQSMCSNDKQLEQLPKR